MEEETGSKLVSWETVTVEGDKTTQPNNDVSLVFVPPGYVSEKDSPQLVFQVDCDASFTLCLSPKEF